MRVRCDHCSSEYDLDDRQVPPWGTSVRCSVCAHVFEVRSNDDATRGDLASAFAPITSAGDELTWQIRTQEGMLFEAPDLATIETWVLEGRLLADDEASRSGRVWLRLAELPELAMVFAGAAPSQPTPGLDGLPRDEAVPPPPNFAEMDFLARVHDDDDAPNEPLWRSRQPEDGVLATGKAVPMTGPVGLASSAARLGDTPEREGRDDPPEDDPPEVAPPEVAAPELLLSPFDDRPAPRPGRRVSIVAAAGLLVGVGVVFGHPAIRAQVLSIGAPTTSASSLAPRQSAEAATLAADEAIASGGLTALAQSEADLQRALDRGDSPEPTRTELSVVLADVLATRSMLYSMAATIDQGRASSLRESARDDLTRAATLVGEVRVVPTRIIGRVGLVRAQVRLAQGRAASDILPLLPPADEDEVLARRLGELADLVAVQGAWSTSPAAPAADAVAAIVARARAAEPSGLAVGAAMLALLATGDVAAAESLQTSLRARAEDHPLAAVPLSAGQDPGTASLTAADDGDTTGAAAMGDGSALVADASVTGTATGVSGVAQGGAAQAGAVAVPDSAGQGTAGETPAGTSAGAGKGGASKASGGGKGFDALLERGCTQVESGSASAGVTTLLQAFDLDPGDADVNLCLGIGYAKLNNPGRALHFYEKALDASPKHRAALAGAADAANKNGNEGKAKGFYERLLAVDPSDAKAKAYLGMKDGEAAGQAAGQAADGSGRTNQPGEPGEGSEGPSGGDPAPSGGGGTTGASGDAQPGNEPTAGPSDPKAGAGAAPPKAAPQEAPKAAPQEAPKAAPQEAPPPSGG